jgi:RecA/RadA recombinase
MSTTKETADAAVRAMLQKPKKEPLHSEKDFLSFGVTLLNLGCYGRTNGGLLKGHVYRIMGRPSGGKTFLARQILCEAALNPDFKDYELIYDDVERGALMDTEKFFPPLVPRLLAPARSKTKQPIYSKGVDDFFDRLRTKLEKGKKLIWVEDSLDVLTGINEGKMTDGKAKYFSGSKGLRSVLDLLESTGSILILVSQARANIGNIFQPDTTSGGRALEHAATLEVWLYKGADIKKLYKGKTKVVIGNWIVANIKKNRISGAPCSVRFPIFMNYGIDNISANVSYLLATEHWGKDKAGIHATEFTQHCTQIQLVEMIERENKQRELEIIVAKVWKHVQGQCQIVRKPKYV